MNATRFVGLRGTKSRLFLYCGALLFLALVVYMYHGCQLQLEELRERSEKCHQQEESLSAQLQGKCLFLVSAKELGGCCQDLLQWNGGVNMIMPNVKNEGVMDYT